MEKTMKKKPEVSEKPMGFKVIVNEVKNDKLALASFLSLIHI